MLDMSYSPYYDDIRFCENSNVTYIYENIDNFVKDLENYKTKQERQQKDYLEKYKSKNHEISKIENVQKILINDYPEELL